MSSYITQALLVAIILCYPLFGVSEGGLKVGFYSKICPNAESIVRSVVEEAFQNNPQTRPILLRLQFHDCFVEGCDGSILITNVGNPERTAPGHLGVAGFEVIDKAKLKLEDTCPGVVSCADIIALVARDALALNNGPFYKVPTGRRDGRVSDASLAMNMPEVDDSIELLKSKFIQKGLSDKDLVVLSGVHTIGTTACLFMRKRLYNFTGRNDTDPKINPDFLSKLEAECAEGGDMFSRIPLDPRTPDTFDDQIMHNIKDGFGVIASDARLYDDNVTKQVVESFLVAKGSFEQDFALAMVKMGQIDVKTGSEGEIRRTCSSFN